MFCRAGDGVTVVQATPLLSTGVAYKVVAFSHPFVMQETEEEPLGMEVLLICRGALYEFAVRVLRHFLAAFPWVGIICCCAQCADQCTNVAYFCLCLCFRLADTYKSIMFS